MTPDVERAVLDPMRLEAVAAAGVIRDGPRDSLQRLVSLASFLLEAPFAFATAVDDRVSWYMAATGLLEGGPTCADVDESFCKYVIASDEPLMVNDARLDPLTADNGSIESMGVVAWAGYPIHTVEGEVLGSFCVVDTVPREWTDRDRQVLETLSKSASAEIQLWSSLAAERRARTRADALLVAAQSLAEALTMEAIVDSLGVVTHEQFGADLGAIVRRDPHDATVLTTLGGWRYEDRLRMPRFRRFPIDATRVIREAFSSEHPVFISSQDEVRQRWPGAELPRAVAGHESWALLPFEIGGVTSGLLLLSYRRPHAFSAQDRTLLVGLAAQVGQAVLRAERFEFERDASTQLQLSLLGPTPLTVPGFELGARYIAGSRGLHVGGDWYDVIVVDERRTLFVIGDVVGHGLRAATAMGELRAVTRAFAALGDPAAILERLDAFARAEPAVSCATVVCALFDRVERTLSLASAGHLPPLVRTASGVETLNVGRGAPLGTRDAARSADTVSIAQSFTMLLFTDGLVERRGTLIDEQIDELAAVFGTLDDLGPEAIIDAVVSAMSPCRYRCDDVAVLCIQA